MAWRQQERLAWRLARRLGLARRMLGLRLVVGWRGHRDEPVVGLAVVVERPVLGLVGFVGRANLVDGLRGSGRLRRAGSAAERSGRPVRTLGGPGDLVLLHESCGLLSVCAELLEALDACRTRLDSTTARAAAAARLTLPREGSALT